MESKSYYCAPLHSIPLVKPEEVFTFGEAEGSSNQWDKYCHPINLVVKSGENICAS